MFERSLNNFITLCKTKRDIVQNVVGSEFHSLIDVLANPNNNASELEFFRYNP